MRGGNKSYSSLNKRELIRGVILSSVFFSRMTNDY
jgi:hypothetical protein